VAAPWEELVGEAYLTLWCTILDGVSSYRGGEVWGTHLGGLQPVRSSGAGRAAARLKL
jgi:hypothetical protein